MRRPRPSEFHDMTGQSPCRQGGAPIARRIGHQFLQLPARRHCADAGTVSSIYLERQGVQVLVFAPVGDKPAFAHKGTIVEIPSIPLPQRPEYRLALGPCRPPRANAWTRSGRTSSISRFPICWAMAPCASEKKRNIPVVASYHTRYEAYMQH